MTVKELKAYKSDRTADLARDLSEFEKNFILVTGGLLAFSITFIKDIVKIESSEHLLYLFLGWGLNVVAIGLMMYTWMYSSHASHKLWIIADDFLIANKYHDDVTVVSEDQWLKIKGVINPYFLKAKSNLSRLRKCAVGVFLAGVVCLAFFVGDNLIKENKIKEVPSKSNYYFLIGKDTLKVKDSLIIIKHKP